MDLLPTAFERIQKSLDGERKNENLIRSEIQVISRMNLSKKHFRKVCNAFGRPTVKTNRRKNLLVQLFTQSEEELEDLFHTYEFEQVVYFSNYCLASRRIAGRGRYAGLWAAVLLQKRQIRIIYLTGLETIMIL